MSKKILIIGGVAGGASAAARLRRLDESAEIILFERGQYISYANCGLPYHVGDVISERQALLVQTAEAMADKFKIDVRTMQEVTAIDRQNKTVEVKNLQTDETYTESYDKLILATGSSPVKPPIEGIKSEGIFTLWTIPDADRIRAWIDEKRPQRAAIIGGGFIGLEMAENLHLRGLNVTVIEMLNQVMAPIDYEMAQMVQMNMRMNGVDLRLGDGVKTFEKKDGAIDITLQSGNVVRADLVILSIGVRPNSELAKKAGLALNAKGGVITDEYLRTSDPDIYAVGDVIEVEEFISKGRTMVPLAGPANRQARICANNINSDSGTEERYNGTQGTSVAQIFDLTVATTGVNEKTLERWGKKYKEDYEVVLIYQKSHAGYYPGATPMQLKLIFEPSGKILGAQIIGQDGVDKRIDTIASVIRLGGDIYALKELELAYAPPFSSAKDPVNMLGFVAENILKGLVSFIRWNEIDENGRYTGNEPYTVLDVGEEAERMAFAMGNSKHIPLSELRKRMGELDKDKLIIVYCAIGVRSYNAARILMGNGFPRVKVYPGGSSFFKTLFDEKLRRESLPEPTAAPAHPEHKEQPVQLKDIQAKIQVDCSGLQCPGPIMRVFTTMKEITDGEIIEVSATDMGFARDIEAWCRKTGNTLLKTEKRGKETVVYIQKGIHDLVPSGNAAPHETANAPTLQGKTLIVFSGELDRVLASFIIANGAAAMGRPVTMFFTFWGLNVLRKSEKQHIKKPFVEKMFGSMMPRGVEKLKLSKMNMGGMGTAMMKRVMRDKNVDSLPDLIRKAMENGVRIVACTMSMDIMGITKEELIDGVEFAGVGSYLGDAEEANVNLFV